MASSNQSRKSLHLLPRSGAELSSLTGLRVSCMQTQALNMTRSAAVGVSKTGMKGNRTRRKLHLPGFGLRPARRTTPRTPELRVCWSSLVRSTRLLLHTRLGGPSGQSFSRSASPEAQARLRLIMLRTVSFRFGLFRRRPPPPQRSKDPRILRGPGRRSSHKSRTCCGQ